VTFNVGFLLYGRCIGKNAFHVAQQKAPTKPSVATHPEALTVTDRIY
jgi:hypothetical protein